MSISSTSYRNYAHSVNFIQALPTIVFRRTLIWGVYLRPGKLRVVARGKTPEQGMTREQVRRWPSPPPVQVSENAPPFEVRSVIPSENEKLGQFCEHKYDSVYRFYIAMTGRQRLARRKYKLQPQFWVGSPRTAPSLLHHCIGYPQSYDPGGFDLLCTRFIRQSGH